MATLAEHEAFLRAIFDAPADDTPRLVYADFLEEHGDADRAAYIRADCEAARVDPDDPRGSGFHDVLVALRSRHPLDWPWNGKSTDRGLPLPGTVVIPAPRLDEFPAIREAAVRPSPEWFGARALKLTRGAPLGPAQVEALFELPFTRQVTEWDLGGHFEERFDPTEPGDAGTFGLIDMDHDPVITVEGVEALARSRAARRIETLILTHNDLDNDAARALVRSPYLIRLARLDLHPGNRFSGTVWQQLRERFGAAVLGD
jgi:uncharacterized protein (TIGR02996 family)